jgi:hypothetical protein
MYIYILKSKILGRAAALKQLRPWRQNKYDTRNNKIKIKFRTKLTTVELVI